MTSLLVILEATLGGTRRHVVDLLSSLDATAYNITFIYSSDRADKAFSTALKKLYDRGIRLQDVRMDRKIDLISDIRALIKIIALIREIRPTIIHVHGAKAGALGRVAAVLCGINEIVYTPHGGAFHKFASLGGKLYLGVERFLYLLCDTRYIGVSRHSCKQIIDSLGLPPSKVCLIYNGIDPPSSSPNTMAEVINIADKKLFNILYPAMFLEAKGHVPFIEKIYQSKTKIDPRIRIILAGDGHLRRKIEDTIRVCGLESQIIMLGFIDNMGPLYEKCHMVVLPSKDEAFGYVVLEAMYYGKLIVASKVGGIREIIRHEENGLFLDVDGPGDLAVTLNSYANNSELLNVIAENGKIFVRKYFSLAKMVENTFRLYAASESQCIY